MLVFACTALPLHGYDEHLFVVAVNHVRRSCEESAALFVAAVNYVRRSCEESAALFVVAVNRTGFRAFLEDVFTAKTNRCSS